MFPRPAQSRLVILLLATSLLIASSLSAKPATEATKKKVQGAKQSLLAGARVVQNAVIPPCGNQGNVELQMPSEITATNNVLSTTFDMAPLATTVPVLVFDSKGVLQCNQTPFSLSVYRDPTDGVLKFPGPTMRVRRAVKQSDGTTTPGDRIRVLLQNHLQANADEGCVWAQAPASLCDCSLNPKPQCCSLITTPNGMNCFHGLNDTNLHLHGTHVSPQEPQDWVLLQLQPYGTTTSPATTPMGDPGDVHVGSFQYDVNPLPWNQAEGTHWYHPHKHGSTAEQVANGAAGALIVQGPFDDWLNGYYQGQLREKLMVVQEIHALNFNQSTTVFQPFPLINGQLTPKITMNPGEVQRWRMVAATMEASAQLVIDFNGLAGGNSLAVRQIAMDGVQFSPFNYQCQPLLDTTPCDGVPGDPKFQLSPGNRADFLLRADPADAGKQIVIPYEVFGAIDRQGQTPRRPGGGALRKVVREQTRATLDALAPGALQPAMMVIYVCDPNNPVDKAAGCHNESMNLPPSLPPLPDFLRPIVPNPARAQTVQFQINPTGPNSLPAPNSSFEIYAAGKNDNKPMQFNESCAVWSEPIGPDTGEEWTLSQNLNNFGTAPLHVFHIHTNPFQVVSTYVGGQKVSYDTCPQTITSTTAPCVQPIWMDSLTLPNNSANASLPSVQPVGAAVIRQRFEDYTGPYVIHCHFLGHEDRGMMVAIQTVCPNQQDSWSVTSTTQAECTFGQFLPALPLIGTPACAQATAASAKTMMRMVPETKMQEQTHEHMKKH
jgi:FtsP/CotA-like multicopper oxidase with cupredoxin domain